MRRQRVDFEGAVHHVMNRGVNRQQIYFGDADRVEFGDRLAEINELFGVRTLAYCLMGTHFHLILRTPRAGLSDAMQHLGSVYTRRTNRRIGRDGPLFRGRFHSILVTTDAYLIAAARYVHRNPLELSGVADAASYRWSSYRTYLGLRPEPAFLDTDLLLGLHGHDRLALADHTDGHSELPTGMTWTLDDLEQLIAFEIARFDMLHGNDHEPHTPRVLGRTLLVLLGAADIDPHLARAIDARLAFPSGTARRMAISRARRRAADDAPLRHILDRLRHHLAEHRRAA
jgi:REP element-mobilizing transposase RayT